MINRQVNRKNVLDALTFIDENGVPPRRRATRYNLYHNKKMYPPKYVLSVATKIATGKGLISSQFSGGSETNDFLIGLGFTLREGEKILQLSKSLRDRTTELYSAYLDWNVCSL